MKLLMLEDNPLDADLCIRAITNELPGCTIDNADTLAHARSLLNSSTAYDLALLDMNLPDGNGLELLTEIRESGIDMAVILFTSTGNEELAVAALKAGADDYIAKKQDYSIQLPSLIKLTLANHQKTKNDQSKALKLLYVEHNTIDVDLTLRHLKKYTPQFAVEVVATAEEALLKLKNKSESLPDVVLMDYRLTGTNALDFIKTVRQEMVLDVPIIIVTGQGDEEIAVQAIKLGANDYLTKNENYLFSLPLMITNAYQQAQLLRKQIKLAESEAKYRLIAENAGDVVFTLDKELHYTYISPSVKNLLGYEPQEIMQRKISDLLTPDSYQRARKTLIDMLLADHHHMPGASLEKQIIELEIIRKDGSILWAEVKASHVGGTPAIPEGILCVARDISRRKKALEELRKVTRAVEQSHSSILITNAKGEIEYVNPKLSVITGYAPEELLGKNPCVLSGREFDDDLAKELWDTLTKGEVWNGEFCNKKKNGEIYWESATISPVTDRFGNITHYVDIRKDITEQKKITKELVEAKVRAEESDRLKSAFLANMSHEIRSPLNSIMGFASLLEQEEDRASIAKYSSIVFKSSEQLVHIIDDIVLYSKLQTNMLSIKENTFEIDPLLEEIDDFFRLTEYQQSIQLVIVPAPQNPGVIRTDREKLKQILVNLISNAYKYTSEGTIWAGCIAEANHYRFFVEDTGMGIPADELSKIFDRFFRGRNVLKSVIGGTGLGLSIVKELVSLLGGEIWAESEEGKGTTFYFTVPFNEMSLS